MGHKLDSSEDSLDLIYAATYGAFIAKMEGKTGREFRTRTVLIFLR